LSLAGDGKADVASVSNPIDHALLLKLASLVEASTNAFEDFDYARALERTEQFFWRFTDDYVELVKTRAYGSQGAEEASSAHAALSITLDTLLRLFAPFLPFVTAEVWSWSASDSVHRATWPTHEDLLSQLSGEVDTELFDVASETLSEVRRAKTEAKRSLKVEAESVVVYADRGRLNLLELARTDLMEAGNISNLDLVEQQQGTTRVEVTLAEEN
jgi:valyl-tRNA synthetase